MPPIKRIVLYHRAELWRHAHGIVDWGFLFKHVDEKGTGMYASSEMDEWIGGEVQFRLVLEYSRLADYWDSNIQKAVAAYYAKGAQETDAILDSLKVDGIAHASVVKIRPGATVRIKAFRRLGIEPSRWLGFNQASPESRQRAHVVIDRWQNGS